METGRAACLFQFAQIPKSDYLKKIMIMIDMKIRIFSSCNYLKDTKLRFLGSRLSLSQRNFKIREVFH